MRRRAAWLISPEGSDYDWLRPVLHAGLREAAGRRAEGAVAAAAHELLDELLARERFDVVSDYAFALSGVALADFLGVERADAGRLMRWAVDIVAFFNDAEITTPAAATMASSAAEMVAYAHGLLGAERAETAGGYLGLAARTAQRSGHELGDEAVGNLALPYLTGQVAVAQLVANSVWLLLGHEDQRARLAADPALVGGALGETLRYLPPASLAMRIALEPIDLRGHRVEAGQTIQLSLAAADATRSASRTPTASTSPAGRPALSASGTGCTAASAPGWRGCRPPSPCARSWTARPSSRSMPNARSSGARWPASRARRRWASALQQRPQLVRVGHRRAAGEALAHVGRRAAVDGRAVLHEAPPPSAPRQGRQRPRGAAARLAHDGGQRRHARRVAGQGDLAPRREVEVERLQQVPEGAGVADRDLVQTARAAPAPAPRRRARR